MRYTKSDMVLALTENIYEQQDVALVERVQRGFGMDFMNEEEFTDDDLQSIYENPEEFFEFNPFTDIGSYFAAKHAAPALAASAAKANAAQAHLAQVKAAAPQGLGHQIAGHVTHGVQAVGHTVTGGLQGAATAAGAPAGGAVHGALGSMAAHPGMVGAAALGLGAAAALRMRSNMKARAAARMGGVR